jgi:hypothetical protein
MVKKNTSFTKSQFDETFYTKFDSNFMWDSNGYPNIHNKTLVECKEICDASKIKLEAIRLSQTLQKEPESSFLVLVDENHSHWTDQQLKEIQQEKITNALLLAKDKQDRIEWLQKIDKVREEY